MPALREVHVDDSARDLPATRLQGRRVLVLLDLTRRGEAVLQHATGIAANGRAALLAVHVIDKRPLFESDGPCGQFLPEERLFFTARAAARKLDLLLARNNAAWAESTVLYGKTEEALAALVRRWRPDVIVVDATIARRRGVADGFASAQGSARVLTLQHADQIPPSPGEDNVKRPARYRPHGRQVARTLLLGALTGVLYWLLFAHERTILDLTAKGQWYFIVPLVIAFVFSFAHGAFTAEFWNALGVRARRKR